MAAIRRNPLLSAVVAGFLLTLTVSLVLWPRSQAHAEPAGNPLSAVEAARLHGLRTGGGFDDDVLASLNPTSEQLAAALPALRTWYETHRSDWLAASSAVADQRARIRLLRSALDNGQDVGAALTAAEQQLAQLENAYAVQLADLRAGCVATLSASQQALLEHMRTHPSAAMPLRVLELTAEQDTTLVRAATDYQQRLALARDAQARAALTAAYAQELQSLLSPTQRQQLVALAEYRGTAAERVVAALESTFPVTPEG